MSCNDFQAKFDLFVDGELGADDMRHAAEHIKCCTTCDALVTRNQRLHAFLVTAVTDRVAAVDVSGLWDGIEERLTQGAGAPPFAVRRPSRVPYSERLVDWLGALLGDGGLSPARIGGMAAVAAAAVVFVASLAVDRASNPAVVASAPVSTQVAAVSHIEHVRPVSIDSMEVGEGHTVSTWMRPKTRTRVLWVAAASDFSDGFAVDSASLDR